MGVAGELGLGLGLGVGSAMANLTVTTQYCYITAIFTPTLTYAWCELLQHWYLFYTNRGMLSCTLAYVSVAIPMHAQVLHAAYETHARTL